MNYRKQYRRNKNPTFTSPPLYYSRGGLWNGTGSGPQGGRGVVGGGGPNQPNYTCTPFLNSGRRSMVSTSTPPPLYHSRGGFWNGTGSGPQGGRGVNGGGGPNQPNYTCTPFLNSGRRSMVSTSTPPPLYHSRGGFWNGTGSGPQGGRGVNGGGGPNQPNYTCTPFLNSGRRSMVSTSTPPPLYHSRGGFWNGTGSGPQGGRGVNGGGGPNQPNYTCTPFLNSGRRSMVSTSTPPPLYHSRGGFWNGTGSGPQGGRGVNGGGGPNQPNYTCTPFLNSGRRSMVSTSTPPPLYHSRGGFWNGTGSGPQGGRGVNGGGGPNQPNYTCTPFLNSGRRSVHSTFSVPPVSHSLVFGGPLTGAGSGPQGGGGIARGGGPTLPTHTITPFLTSGNLNNRKSVPRRDESNPKKMDEVKFEAERETMEQNQLTYLHMSRGSMAGGMGRRGDGKHNQRSPSNPEEKKKYERDFLLLLQNNPESIKKPENLPDIILKVSTKRQQELNAAMRGILNKLTPQNFEKLVNQVLKLPIDTMDKLVGVINLVFDKAVDEPHFSVVYAELCNYLNDANIVRQVSKGEDSNNNNFRKILLKRCQKEFQKDKAAESGLHEREKEIKKKEMRLVMEEDERRMKRKSVGVTRFIGELYKLGMINQSTIVTFIEELLEAGDEESLEQFCIFITTVGKVLEEALQKVATGEPNTPNLQIFFNKIKNIINERKTSARVRFMLQDVIDLKNRNWVPRRDESVPKKLDEVKFEAERETMEQNQLTYLHMSRGSMAGGMGRRGDGKHTGASTGGGSQEGKSLQQPRLHALPIIHPITGDEICKEIVRSEENRGATFNSPAQTEKEENISEFDYKIEKTSDSSSESEAKNREWVPQRDESNPKKMVEVNFEAERETMEQNQLTYLHMSRESMAGGMGRRGDGKHNQWSPSNPEEKKKYERDFLLLLQNNPESIKKPENLPDIVMKVSTKRVNKDTNHTSRRARIRKFISRIRKSLCFCICK